MPESKNIELHDAWLVHLAEQFEQEYMQVLSAFLREEKRAGKTIYPRGSQIFNALNTTPLDSVKVVILGQDPYHGPGQAHGLCFSVPDGIDAPPSLRNIFKELQSDMGVQPPASGNLQRWAEQGVLLLNSVLTVEAGQAGSHANRGWERFTDSVIDVVNRQRKQVVFLLWGSYAQKKGALIDTATHLVLKAPHPSPLSAHRGFFGCAHFSKANDYLVTNGQLAVNW
ncbi:MAG: uracil-DNA glycosylase [Gammaproteobacteria bacterium]|nr:uracil-DNA glycosylase [Gammaproteobacteria bacterium]NND38890.1 uracil-DNA glycosylase [Pseudomonadales bacterium]NNL11147.1 uracil-DNA glycosylase [Pseudomonadales bacterium]NNM11609.1 uracil-DNA glycosylase [Pseudomonadales bacterium]RZV56118.1 MAG: uracil-DNA glycosylase [Pseudomonadales bacterium]